MPKSMPSLGTGAACLFSGMTLNRPHTPYPFQNVITSPPATIKLPPTQIGTVGDC